MNPILSVLVCSLERRKRFYERLLFCLGKQPLFNVEIVTKNDKGEMTIGAKRNWLLDHAHGEYVAFIDDDDLVADDYVALILDAIKKSQPDVIGFKLKHFVNENHIGDTEHSMKYDTWVNDTSVNPARYYRCPNHLNPVKRELALKVKYANISAGEDRDYSLRLRPLLKTEEMIDKQIYFYKERTESKTV